MLAMTALSMQALSGGRFILGIGTSGPQVMEGWHGVRFDRPLARTRETIEIVRSICAGERLEHHGQVYDIPLPDSQGKALRSPIPSVHIPIYIASLGPANLALTGAMADGWIGNSFFPESAEVFFGPIREAAVAAGRSFSDIDLTVAAALEFTDDVAAAGRRHADGYAFTFGAMGSPTQNFYADAFARQGYAEVVVESARLWRAGDRAAAAAAIPLEVGVATNLIGSPEEVKVRLRRYRDAGVTTLRVGLQGSYGMMAPGSAVAAAAKRSGSSLAPQTHARLDALGTFLDLVEEVNQERDQRK